MANLVLYPLVLSDTSCSLLISPSQSFSSRIISFSAQSHNTSLSSTTHECSGVNDTSATTTHERSEIDDTSPVPPTREHSDADNTPASTTRKHSETDDTPMSTAHEHAEFDNRSLPVLFAISNDHKNNISS